MARRIVCRCRSRPSSPIHAMSAAYSRSSLRSKQPPPSARHVRPHGPEPSAPHGSGLQERICSSSCLSWLHLLKSWSLRQSRGGSNRTSGKAIATGANLESVSVGFSDIIKTVGPKALEALGGKTLAEMAQSSTFLMVRDQIICIDDIERKGKDLRAIDILGLVSMLAEQRNCKVVIIMNDDQLEEKVEFNK